MDPALEKQQLLEELEGSNRGKLNVDSIRKYLKLVRAITLAFLIWPKVRELRTGESESVAIYGTVLLQKHRKKLLTEELWLVHEQVAIALLECQAIGSAQSCIAAICTAFPNSVRAKRLKAMLYEATDNLSRAESIYDTILSQDATNDIILKRKVAICKTRGDFVSAAKELTTYLETFTMDREGWDELAQIYLKMQMYKQAAYCYEELLLLAPSHLTYSIRYADVLYTIGTAESIKTAQAYYANAIEASQGSSLRALYGIVLCTTHSVTKKDSAEGLELQELSKKAIITHYSQEESPFLPYVKNLLGMDA